ncbi:unnamed protein product [Meganyctiphanes norvegica]|uniref:Secreted protein n=1 Tax=Meganyctiphanes norvegica TaxID=48144 RepID=A0AAV2S2X0_MEGNR
MVMLLIVVGLCCALQVTTAESYTCYECTDDPDQGGHTYDPNCGSYHYQGHTQTKIDYVSCGIYIWNNGYTTRFIAGNAYDDGECRYHPTHTSCLCRGALCNTDSFCDQCGYPRPTPGTTEAITTTVTTTPATPTKCYSCIGCFSVEEGTTPVVEDGFTSCMTTVYQDRPL